MKMSRKILSFVILLALTAVILLIPGCNRADGTDAALVLTNGIIYTVDGDNWHNEPAEAVAVCADGLILFVGTAANAERFIGRDTQVIDLEGQVMFPGFIDTHIHVPGSMLTYLFKIYLYESGTLEQTLADVAAFIDANPDNDEYWGIGYSPAIGSDPRGPRAEWLDEICSEKPIILISNDEHSYWMNSVALAMNGITPDTLVPPGGSIPIDPETGKLWGTLTGATAVITMERPAYTMEQQLEAMLRFQENMHGWGFTSAMCLVPHFIDNEAYLAFYESGQLALRLNLAGGQYEPGWDFDEVVGEAMVWREALRGNELLRVSSMKIFADGVVEGMTAYLSEPYDAAAGLEPGFRSDFNWDIAELKDIAARMVAEGFQLYIHTIGDAATTEMMNILEYIKAQNPNTDHRTVFAHLQLVSDNDKTRMGRLGVIGNTQPFWHIRAPGWFDEVELILLGEERAMTMYPVRSLIDAGVTVTFSGDHPVTANNNPFWAIEAAVTRNLYSGELGAPDITDIDDPTWLLNPDERISVKQAIEAYTINGAYQLFRENEIGSITVGKRADFIVVDLDIFNINPLDISETQVMMTFFNGERVR